MSAAERGAICQLVIGIKKPDEICEEMRSADELSDELPFSSLVRLCGLRAFPPPVCLLRFGRPLVR